MTVSYCPTTVTRHVLRIPINKARSTCSVILCNRIKITVSVEFDNQGQSFGRYHDQMHTFSWCNYERRPCEAKPVRNCETSGYSAINALGKQRKKKTRCQLESRMVYVKKCTFTHNPLKLALTKNGRGTSQWTMYL